MTKNKMITLLCPLSFLAFGIYIRIDTMKMRAGDATFPNIVAYIIIAVSLIQLFSDLKGEHKSNRFSGVNFPKVILCLVAMCGYVFLLKKIGFIIDTILLTALTMYILDYKNYKVIAMTSVLITAVVFIAFKILLRVPLPTIWL